MEPRRITNLKLLNPDLENNIVKIMLELTREGYDPIVFETSRTSKRQAYLYAIGRTREKHRKPVTWKKHSKHQDGLACDIISKSKGWDWPHFYARLRHIAFKNGCDVLSVEGCHVELDDSILNGGD
jgi:hypothetical protein